MRNEPRRSTISRILTPSAAFFKSRPRSARPVRSGATVKNVQSSLVLAADRTCHRAYHAW
ncbi:MAG: hypothetical protein HY815_20120 [Candidatus Riflebacteria bacterium]|nr:hypothetical protein [Candidatus Riflebacteria bacterium]